ncbi:MAG: hypothetical protein ACFHW5_11550 [Verrucomicrobiota bacterium]
MNNLNNARSNPSATTARLLTMLATIISCTTLYGQETAASTITPSPALSETTLKILEAQTQATMQSPEIKTPEESQLTTKKPRKLETGGLLKEWLAPFERKKMDGQDSRESDSKGHRIPIWKWFDPTAPLSDPELKAKPIDWKGRRTVPQSFGSPQKTDPEGLKLFFIRYK